MIVVVPLATGMEHHVMPRRMQGTGREPLVEREQGEGQAFG
jgi:hypothetical protein